MLNIGLGITHHSKKMHLKVKFIDESLSDNGSKLSLSLFKFHSRPTSYKES